jgi:hypothetical protein
MKKRKTKRKSDYQIRIHQEKILNYAKKKNIRVWYLTKNGWAMPYEIEEFVSLRKKELRFLNQLLKEEKYVELSGCLVALCFKQKRYDQLFDTMIGILKKHKILTNPFTPESGLNEI